MSLPLRYSDEFANAPLKTGQYTPSLPNSPQVSELLRSGTPYCFSDKSIWYQDGFNDDIFVRSWAVPILASRTLELNPFPEQTLNQSIYKRILAEQQRFDNEACPNNPLKSYNSHYQMPLAKHDLANIRNVPLENELMRLGHLIDEDCFTDSLIGAVENGRMLSEIQIADKFKYETSFPKETPNAFDTNTSVLLRTVDNRNKYVQRTSDIYPYVSQFGVQTFKIQKGT